MEFLSKISSEQGAADFGGKNVFLLAEASVAQSVKRSGLRSLNRGATELM